MSDKVDYIIAIEDQGSQTLQKIGMGADSAVSKVKKLQNETSGLYQKIGAGNRNIVNPATIQSVDKTITKVKDLGVEIQKTDTKGKTAGNGWFSSALSQIPFVNLLTNPLILAGAAAGNAIRLGIQQDLTNTSFEVSLKSKEAAKQLISEITDYGAKTPYDKMGIANNAKTMLGFGIDSESIMPNLKAIGDIAMGDSNKMNSLTLAFSQMSSTGKLTGQDLLQMINAGFNPLNEISKKTGKSIGQLKEDMEKSKISSQMVKEAFYSAAAEGGQFHKMAISMGQTLGGKFAQVMDNINEKFLILYDLIQPIVMKGIEFADVAINGIVDGLIKFVNKIKQVNPYAMAFLIIIGSITLALGIMKLATMAQTTWTAALTLATNLSTKAWWQNNAALLANPVTWIIAGVVALIALIALLIYKVDGWGKAWENTIEVVKALWNGYLSSIKLNWLVFENIVLSGIDKIKIGWYSVKKLWGEDSANEAIEQIKAQSEARKKAIGEESKKIVESGKKAWEYTKKAAGSLTINNNGFGDVKKDLESKLGISSPKGVAGAASMGFQDKNTKEKKGNGAKTNRSIATGGQRSNYITIHLKDLIGVLNIQGRDFKDSADQMTEHTADALLRLLAMANATGG